MDLELSGKIALVTGSSSGIGYAIAQQLVAEGSTVILNGRDSARLAHAKDMLPGASAIAADVTDPLECKRLVSDVLTSHGCIDVLVCNVGSGSSVPPGQENPEEWHRVLSINLHSTTQMVWAATSSLAASKGNVVCISSICGLEALGCPIPYAASKAALQSYVCNSAWPLGLHGVRINSVAPGNIMFPGSSWESKVSADPVGVKKMLDRNVALKSFGQPQDIARMVAFLASPLARFITGSTFVVDGGQIRS